MMYRILSKIWCRLSLGLRSGSGISAAATTAGSQSGNSSSKFEVGMLRCVVGGGWDAGGVAAAIIRGLFVGVKSAGLSRRFSATAWSINEAVSA